MNLVINAFKIYHISVATKVLRKFVVKNKHSFVKKIVLIIANMENAVNFVQKYVTNKFVIYNVKLFWIVVINV